MRRDDALIADVRKIAVLRANGIGDLVFVLPALEALRTAYPKAEIVLLGCPWHAEFMTGRPGPVDRTIAIPPSRGVNGGEQQQEDHVALERFFEKMRKERFDLAFQLHGGGRYSNPFVRNLDARVTIGFCSAEAEPLDFNLPYVYLQPEIARYLEVVALAGARAIDLEPHLALTAIDIDEAAAVLPDEGRPLALLHPGASDPRRHWPVENFATVGQALANSGARVLINGTAPERALCEQLQLEIPGAQNLCGRVGLNALIGILARCTVVVSNDTGPLHLANALGVATVGIYWCLNLFNASPLTRRLHRPFVSCCTHCPVCGQDCMHGRCDHEASFVADVPVEPVCEAAVSLYAQSLQNGRAIAMKSASGYLSFS